MHDKRRTELQEKFVRIYKEHRHIDLEIIDIVYETVKQMLRNKQDTTAANIAKECNMDKGKVVRRLITLADSNYVRVIKNRTIPFLSVYNRSDSKKPIYGREKIQKEIDENYGTVKSILLSNAALTDIDKDILDKFNAFSTKKREGSTFFKVYNQVVDFLVNKGISGMWYMEIRSGANRYVI